MSLKELICRKQGNNEPTDFSKQTGSNNAVFAQVAGLVPGAILVGMPTLWGGFPNLRIFVINKFPTDFPFDDSDLAKQSSVMIELLSRRCDDVAMGILMTHNSNQTRSDINLEVHKNLLANHLETRS